MLKAPAYSSSWCINPKYNEAISQVYHTQPASLRNAALVELAERCKKERSSLFTTKFELARGQTAYTISSQFSSYIFQARHSARIFYTVDVNTLSFRQLMAILRTSDQRLLASPPPVMNFSQEITPVEGSYEPPASAQKIKYQTTSL